MSKSKFTIERDRWYGLSMYPGYGDVSYFSPIQVQLVNLLGNKLIEIEYINAGYAEGVQLMKKKYIVHRRSEFHVILNEIHVPERTVILEPLSASWIISRAPWFVGRLPQLQ